MPELRLNLISREWVIIAKEKGKNPEDFIESKVIKRQPDYTETCPFCPGNESKTPHDICTIHDDRGWRIRVMWNKFSKLSVDGERKRWNTELRKSVNGVGIHEIIIETPYHSHTTATMPAEQLREVIQIYRDRFIEAYKDPRVEHVVIFKNSGSSAGTTVEHSLSQIVGLPITPLSVRSRIEGAMRFFDETGDCLVCRTVGDEIGDGSRILCETEHFVSLVPYAALSPFHIWMFPKRHSGSFAGIHPEEIWDLAVNLKMTMAKLYYGLEQPDFNYVLRSGNPSHVGSEFIHWYLSIVPRISMATGFELGSGMYINPVAPEAGAQFLRNVKVP